jgi:hypothetical protein
MGIQLGAGRSYVSGFWPFIMTNKRRFPAFVFRGQLLSIAIAAFLLALVLLREWFMQHNWSEHLNPKTRATPEEINPNHWVVTCGIAFKKTDLVEARKFVHDLAREGEEKAQGVIPGGRRRAGAGRLERDRDRGRKEVMIMMAEEIERRRSQDPKNAAKEGRGQKLAARWAARQQSIKGTTTTDTVTATPNEEVKDDQFPETIEGDGTFATTAERMLSEKKHNDAIRSAGPSGYSAPPAYGDTMGSDPVTAGPSTRVPLLSPTSGLPRPADVARIPSLAYKAPEMISERARGKQRADQGVQTDESGGPSNVIDTLDGRSGPDEVGGAEPTSSALKMDDDGDEGWEDVEDNDRGVLDRSSVVDTPSEDDDPLRPRSEQVPMVPLPLPGLLTEGQAALAEEDQRTVDQLLAAILDEHGIQPADPNLPLPAAAPVDPIPDIPAAAVRDAMRIDFVDDEDLDAAWDREDWDGILEGEWRSSMSFPLVRY